MTCIISPQFKDSDGYARKWYNGRVHPHHRVVYAEHNNIDLENMKGLVVMHTCDNPSCVNPLHLRLGTQKDNIRDMDNKERRCRGVAHHSSQLTEQQVLDIRASSKSYKDLSIEYKVSKRTIYDIIKRKTWKWL